jgi:hypothetical protein
MYANVRSTTSLRRRCIAFPFDRFIRRRLFKAARRWGSGLFGQLADSTVWDSGIYTPLAPE